MRLKFLYSSGLSWIAAWYWGHSVRIHSLVYCKFKHKCKQEHASGQAGEVKVPKRLVRLKHYWYALLIGVSCLFSLANVLVKVMVKAELLKESLSGDPLKVLKSAVRSYTGGRLRTGLSTCVPIDPSCSSVKVSIPWWGSLTPARVHFLFVPLPTLSSFPGLPLSIPSQVGSCPLSPDCFWLGSWDTLRDNGHERDVRLGLGDYALVPFVSLIEFWTKSPFQICFLSTIKSTYEFNKVSSYKSF